MSALPIALMTDDDVAAFARDRDPEAGFGALTCAAGALPLVAMDVDARVSGVIAQLELAQTFANATRGAIEATYIFPLPDRMAVHRFRMEVAGRVIEGVVDERGVAREQYDEAIAAGHRAAIAEEERPGVFTLRVGNLLAGERATVRLSLVGPLPVDDGEVTLRFPLVVAPRYIPGAVLGGEQAGLGDAPDTDAVPDASRISPPVRLPGVPNPVRLSLRVSLADRDVRDLAASLHAVTVSHRDAQIVELRPGERLDRDFILRWRVAPGAGHALASALTCADDADGRGGTFALTLVPPSGASLSARPRDVVFVIDRSGSMRGWKMVAARRAAARMIDTLTSRDRFCAIAFDDLVELLPSPQLAEATDRARFAAVEALSNIDARGGTELAEPLHRAIALLGPAQSSRERVIVLVTDGQVGDEDRILRELVPDVRGTRVFALGIDRAVNAGFLRRLASAGAGLCELVESEDRLDAVMAKVHRRIGTPVVTELALRAHGLAVEPESYAPARLPDVYAGAPVTVLGRYRGRAPAGAALEVTGAALGEPLAERIVRDPDSARASAWLGASWARARIRDLEDRYAAGDSRVEPDIVATSKRFGVLSRFTAFLAVDRSEVANPGGRASSIVQPVERPFGWADELSSGSGSSGGATGPVLSLPMPAPRVMPSPAAPPGAPPPIVLGSRMPMPQSIASPSASYTPPAPESRSRATPSAPQSFEPLPPPPSPAAPSSPSVPPSPAAPPPPRKVLARIGALFGSSAAGEPKPAAYEATVDPALDAYLPRLAALAAELAALAALASGTRDLAALRLLRQRLVEWLEDVRSVGHRTALAAAVEALVTALTSALASGAPSADALRPLAASLASLAAGDPPPPPKPRAFWK